MTTAEADGLTSPAHGGIGRDSAGSVAATLLRGVGLVVAGSLLCACGAGGLASTVSPKARPEGAVDHGGERPLLVDWGASDRTVFDTSRGQGPLVVVFGHGRLEPLSNCHASGQYRYTAEHSAQVQDDIIENADDLHARMPNFGAKYEAALQRMGKLHLRMKVVGLYEADKTTFSLQGECARATHIATHVTVGAFRLFTLSRGDLKGDVAVPLGGALEGGSHADEQALNAAGDESACDRATSGDLQPPDGCTTSLQLTLIPILASSGSISGPSTDASAHGYVEEQRGETRQPTGSVSLGRTLGWVGLGIGATGLAVAVTTSILLLNDKSTRDADCNAQKQCSQAGLDAAGGIHSLVPWNWAGWIVGAVGAGAGAYFLFTTPSSTSAQTGLVVAPSAGGARISLERTFW